MTEHTEVVQAQDAFASMPKDQFAWLTTGLRETIEAMEKNAQMVNEAFERSEKRWKKLEAAVERMKEVEATIEKRENLEMWLSEQNMTRNSIIQETQLLSAVECGNLVLELLDRALSQEQVVSQDQEMSYFGLVKQVNETKISLRNRKELRDKLKKQHGAERSQELDEEVKLYFENIHAPASPLTLLPKMEAEIATDEALVRKLEQLISAAEEAVVEELAFVPEFPKDISTLHFQLEKFFEARDFLNSLMYKRIKEGGQKLFTRVEMPSVGLLAGGVHLMRYEQLAKETAEADDQTAHAEAKKVDDTEETKDLEAEEAKEIQLSWLGITAASLVVLISFWTMTRAAASA